LNMGPRSLRRPVLSVLVVVAIISTRSAAVTAPENRKRRHRRDTPRVKIFFLFIVHLSAYYSVRNPKGSDI